MLHAILAPSTVALTVHPTPTSAATNVDCHAGTLMTPGDASTGVRLGTSPGNPQLTTGIPVGKPTGMETRGSELPVSTGLHGSGFLFWCCEYLPQVLGKTKILFIYFTNLSYTFWVPFSLK